MAERVPRLVAHVDVRKFKLDPMDGFLLTRIDGRLGMKALARETGLPEFSVERALEKLEKLGVIENIDPNAPPPPAQLPPPAPSERKAMMQLGAGLFAKYDPAELEKPGDLTPEQKKRVLDYFHRLDDLDHYTLLGVTKEADKKTVKRSYFELAGFFHPDRYFGKNLGTFKQKMEVRFNRITEAHDALTDAAKRMDYDNYLDEVATTRGMEAMLERAMAESAAAAAAAVAPTNGSPSAAPAAASNRPVAPTGPSPAELQARREALARRLTGGASLRPQSQPQPQKPPSNRPDPLRYSNPNDAMDALKRRYEARVEHATLAQAQKYVAAAEEAFAKNDLVAAASSLSIATKFAPDDAALAMRYQETKNKADKILCESYEKLAVYEERAQHWLEAARNWQKVAKIKQDDPKAHERAAHAMVRAPDADLHQAAEHAKQAIALRPTDITNHLALVEIYVKAGLTASARRAAEGAEKVDPKNAKLQELIKKIGKA
jgi:curved DNA-binding protein CbpA